MPATKIFSLILLWAALLGLVACASAPPTDTSSSATASAPTGAAGSPTLSPAAAPGSPPSTPAAGPAAAPNDYRIGPQDLLQLDVFGVEALSKRSVRVNASGQIALPLIGAVQAGGLTAEQLAADIAARLVKDYLQNPQVTIFILEYTSQRVTVAGAVKTPGIFPLKGRTTLMQAVAQAGGPNNVASLSTVKILRPELDGTRKALQFDLAAIRDGQIPDPELQGEDVVQVETSAAKETMQQLKEFVLPFWIIAR